MSEVITVGGASETIYGTYAAAVDYLSLGFGDAYTTWTNLVADNRKKTLAVAARFLNRQAWIDAADTFAERDAIEAFQLASYELAALIASDPTVVAVADQSNNIQSMGAGSAQISFFSPTSVKSGTATLLPPILMALIGEYLAVGATSGPDGGSGLSGSCHNPFSDCSDFDRGEPY